jgi:hypothetical protein
MPAGRRLNADRPVANRHFATRGQPARAMFGLRAGRALRSRRRFAAQLAFGSHPSLERNFTGNGARFSPVVEFGDQEILVGLSSTPRGPLRPRKRRASQTCRNGSKSVPPAKPEGTLTRYCATPTICCPGVKHDPPNYRLLHVKVRHRVWAGQSRRDSLKHNASPFSQHTSPD